MPIDLTVIEPAFRATIRTLLGMADDSVRRANQFNPPPAGDQKSQFATLLITEVDGGGWDDVTYASIPNVDMGYGEGSYGDGGYGEGVISVSETLTGMRYFTASIQFFRGNAKSQAMRLKTLLQSSAALQQLQAAGIGLGKIGTIRDLSKLTDTYIEQRAQLDVDFYVVNQEQLTLPTFGSFPVSVITDSH